MCFKAAFDTFAPQYTNLNFVSADSKVFGGASWAIMNSNVLNYDDIAVDGYIAPPTLVTYANGVKSLDVAFGNGLFRVNFGY